MTRTHDDREFPGEYRHIFVALLTRRAADAVDPLTTTSATQVMLLTDGPLGPSLSLRYDPASPGDRGVCEGRTR